MNDLKLTKDQIYNLLRRSGAANLSALNKGQLVRVMNLAKQGRIPEKYLPKLNKGWHCSSDVRCYTKVCKKSVCAPKSKR